MNEAINGYYELTNALSIYEVVLSMLEKEKDEESFENAIPVYELLETLHSQIRSAQQSIKKGITDARLWEA